MGLWDYEDDDAQLAKSQEVEWQPPSQEAAHHDMEEDEEGNVVVKKKRKGHADKMEAKKQQPRPAAMSKAHSTILLISDDEDDAGADEDKLLFKSKKTLTTSKGGRQQAKANAIDVDDSPYLASPPQPSLSSPTDGRRKGKHVAVSDAARNALEASKMLRQRLESQMNQRDEDQSVAVVVDSSLGPRGLIGSGCASPGGLRTTGPFSRLRQTVGIKRSRDEDEELERMMAAVVDEDEEADLGTKTSAEEAEDNSMITITCQHGSWKVAHKIGQKDKLSLLQAAFLRAAREKSLIEGDAPPPGFKLMFDDRKIDLEATPESLGMEDGDVVDAVWGSKKA